jgi:hypothetical protein
LSQDREFETYLEGKSDVSKLYADLPEGDAPRHLDAAILAEAHRAVNSRPGSKPKRRWVIPLSMAASLIVAVMVGLQLPYMLKDAAIPQQIGEEKMAELLDKSLAEPTSPAPIERHKASEESVDKSALHRRGEAPMAAKLDATVKPEMKISIAPQESKPAPELPRAAPAPVVQHAPVLSNKVKVVDTETRSVGAASVAASPSADVQSQQSGTAAKRLQLRESASLFSGALSKEKKDDRQGGEVVHDSFEKNVAIPAKKATLEAVEQDLVQKQSLKEEASNKVLDPEEWLKRIRKLKQDGKVEDYNRELAEFKKRYPNFLVPKDVDSR